MKQMAALIGFFAFAFVLQAQTSKAVTYKCVFSDTQTMTAVMPDHVIRDMASQAAQSKGLPDSLVGMLDSALRKAISFAGVPTQVQGRSVIASRDTTVIELLDDIQEFGLNADNSFKKMVIWKGRKIVALYNEYDEPLNLPPDEDRNFKPTGQKRTILSYSCTEYLSADGNVTVWITNALPSWINPGVRNVNIEGAILSFAIVRDGGRFVSTIEKLEIIK